METYTVYINYSEKFDKYYPLGSIKKSFFLFFIQTTMTRMNPLRCLAQFIAFLHSQPWTSKSDLIYQFLHYVLLIGFFIVSSFIYLNHFIGLALPVDDRVAVLILIVFLVVVFGYLLLFGKRPYLKSEYKNWQVVIGGIVWGLLWIYIFPIFFILK